MVRTSTTFAIEDVEKRKLQEKKRVLAKKKAECTAKGGTWDEETQTCVLPFSEQVKNIDFSSFAVPKGASKLKEEDKAPEAPITAPEVIRRDVESGLGKITGVRLPGGKDFLGIGGEEVNALVAKSQGEPLPAGTVPAGTAQAQLEQQMQAQQLAGQVGQFEQLGISPTGFDYGELASQGLIRVVPSLLAGLAGIGTAAAITGGTGGAGAGAGVVTGIAAASAVQGMMGSISSGVISNMDSQRTDTIAAQKRVLEEGKQNLNDIASQAASDPANKAYYVAQFNRQLALIDQAYRQMKLDTQRDVAEFETARPDLAEFEYFYSVDGERDILKNKMIAALYQNQSPDYEMLELASRRGDGQGKS